MSSDARSARIEMPADWDRLELSVRRLLDDHASMRERLLAAERRVRELEAALQQVTDGGIDPVQTAARAEALEADNAMLRRRMDEARERIAALLGRLRFLEDAT